MIRAIIVEDELNGLNNLKNMLAEHCPAIKVVGTADSVESADRLLAQYKDQIDLAFLDIQLKNKLVFQSLNKLSRIKFEIIFVTAYENYAIKACKYSAIGYLLKPTDPDELVKAVYRIPPYYGQHINQRYDLFKKNYDHPNAYEKLSVAAVDGIHFVHIREVQRLEAEDNYTHIFLKDGKKLTASKTIKWYEDLLESLNFYRVHKSHVINLNYMTKYVKGEGGYLMMEDGKKIDISRRRRPAFMETMRKLQQGI